MEKEDKTTNVSCTDGLRRKVQINFRVTEAERDLLYEKMALRGVKKLSTYMREIAIYDKN